MKILVTNRRALTVLCLCPADEGTTKKQKFLYIAFSIITNIMVLCAITASFVFFCKNISVDLDASLYSLLQISTFLNVFYMTMAAFTFRQQMGDIFEKLQEIYDANANEEESNFLVEANNKSERLWQIFFKYLLPSIAIPNALNGFTSIAKSFIMIGHFDTQYSHHQQAKLSLPWDEDTLAGYIGKIFFEIMMGEVYLTYIGPFSILFISLCFIHRAFYQQFNYLVHGFEQMGKLQQEQKLCNAIRFHSTVKAFFLDTTEVFSPFVMVQLFCTLIAMACIIFQIDLQMKHIQMNTIFSLVVALISGTTTLFIFCYFGKLATDSFSNMADTIYESKWRCIPVNLQKHFILVIQNAQEPVCYHGFGVFTLNLETFTHLIKSVYTCYMAFKAISSK